MTNLTKYGIALAAALVALPAMASDPVMDRIRLQLHDQSCLTAAEDMLAQDETLTYDQVRLRLQTADCACLDDAACTGDQLRTRTRTGEENGKGAVSRARKGAGHN